jgi:hypothetical protein
MSMTFAATTPTLFAQVFILLALRVRLEHVRSVPDLARKQPTRR